MSDKARAGPVEPATGANVKDPLEEGCCELVGPRIAVAGPISEAPTVTVSDRIKKKASTSNRSQVGI